MPDFCNQTEILLKKTAAASVIERLKENPILQKWVGDGVGLHKGKSVCEFCGGKLSNDLLDKLNAHFSNEYGRLLSEIDQFISTLKDNKASLELHDEARFYKELQKNYKQSKEQH